MNTWLGEIAGWVPIALAWLTTAVIGAAFYFLAIVRLLDSPVESLTGQAPPLLERPPGCLRWVMKPPLY
jgi:hypothetical protein